MSLAQSSKGTKRETKTSVLTSEHGVIAQSVVRRADNAKVPGSIPGNTNFLPIFFFFKNLLERRTPSSHFFFFVCFSLFTAF